MSVDFTLIEVETIGSTNDECRRRAEEGASHGLVVRADRQTKGRGRRGRTWDSPFGNLYCSLLLRPESSLQSASVLGFIAATALGNSIEPLLPSDRVLQHKWPNDILIDGGKVAGFLMEAETDSAGRPQWIVLGMGVNIANHPGNTPYPATDLTAMGVGIISSRSLLQNFLAAFSPLYEEWQESGFSAIAERWLKRAAGLGEKIEVKLDSGSLFGRFLSLDSDGALMLELPSAEIRRISAGDVFFPAQRLRIAQ